MAIPAEDPFDHSIRFVKKNTPKRILKNWVTYDH